MPGFSSGNSACSLPRTLGPNRMSVIEASKPATKPQIAPRVVKRRQHNVSRMAGRFADAATANASATKNATLAFGPSTMAIAMATAPMQNAVTRATRMRSPGRRSLPSWITFTQTSCANDVDAEIVRPATTARIVANAIAAMNAKNKSPPSAFASSGAAMFEPPFCAIVSRPTSVAAPTRGRSS